MSQALVVVGIVVLVSIVTLVIAGIGVLRCCPNPLDVMDVDQD